LFWVAAAVVAMWLASGCTTVVANAVDVSVGHWGSCLLNADGGVECWGEFQNEAGDVVIDYGSSATPVTEIPSGTSDLTLGLGHACAIVFGQVKCWGSNENGQLGVGTTVDAPAPVDVVGLPAGDVAVQVESIGSHTCVRLTSGAVWCWGSGTVGQLGDGLDQDSTSPVQVTGFDGSPGNRATDIATASGFTCAVRPNGTVGCWGTDFDGALGNGPGRADSIVPAPVPGLSNVFALQTGYTHVCTLDTTGTIKCWGANFNDVIGPGGGQFDSPTVYGSFTQPVIRLSGGLTRNCAVYLDNSAACVGSGSLGNGTNVSSSTPSLVLGTDSDPVIEIDTHFQHSCAVGVSGDVRCWGSGFYGQLGNGATTSEFTPVNVVR